jgi:hypothetical protein
VQVDLLYRLMVPGPWDEWVREYNYWERSEWVNSTDIPGPNTVPWVGWVARLNSGAARNGRRNIARLVLFVNNAGMY